MGIDYSKHYLFYKEETWNLMSNNVTILAFLQSD